MAETVRCSRQISGVPSSRLGHSMRVSWWTKRGLRRFFSGFSRFPYHKFYFTISPYSSLSFHFMSPCDGATGVVDRHSCYSLTFILGVNRISSLDPSMCRIWVEDVIHRSYLWVNIVKRTHLRPRKRRWSVSRKQQRYLLGRLARWSTWSACDVGEATVGL